MDWFYIIGLLIIIVSAFNGFKKGLVNTLGSICASILAIGLVYLLKMWAFDAFFSTLLLEHDVILVRIALCLVVYLAAFFLLKAIVMSLRIITKIPVIRGLNKVLGFILGGVYGVVLVGILTLIRSWFL